MDANGQYSRSRLQLIIFRTAFFGAVMVAVEIGNHFGYLIGIAAAIVIGLAVRLFLTPSGTMRMTDTTRIVAVAIFLIAAVLGLIAELSDSAVVWYFAIAIFPVGGLLWYLIRYRQA